MIIIEKVLPYVLFLIGDEKVPNWHLIRFKNCSNIVLPIKLTAKIQLEQIRLKHTEM